VVEVIERTAFGKTGHQSSRTIFGAAALANASHADSERTLDLLLKHGVNHIDTAAAYGDSELRIASWLAREPDHFFLATKTGSRDYAGAKEDIHRSLDRLGVDHVDLIQLHNLVDVIEWEEALRDGGALEAAVEARDEGKVRFIGVTGHGLSVAAVHRRGLDRFQFDSVLLPYNARQQQDARYAEEFDELASVCVERGVAMQTIKSIALRPWEGRPRTRTTWYEPLSDPSDIEIAVHWVLGRPGIFLNTVGDVNLLPLVLEAAERWHGERPSNETVEAMVGRLSLEPLFV
jgi:aryl-alcohol dehydrogenase-like predicted oxidoreductase